jgi:glycosyltransferase involved in cell wall biosynthesis
MRVLFINENIGGHATVHHNIARQLELHHPDVQAEFVDLVAPGLGRRIVAAPIPGLSGLDLDLQPLRSQLAQSFLARQAILRRRGQFDVLHLYTHNVGLLSPDLIRRWPTVVSLDSTNALNAFRLPQRQPTRWTPRVLPLTKSFERRVYRAATLIAAHSQWAANSVVSYGIDTSHVRVVRFGVPLGEAPPPQGSRTGLPEITFVGRQLERKGGWRLIELHQNHLRDRCILNLVTLDAVPSLPGVAVFNDITPGDARLGEILRRSTAFVFPSEIDQAPNAIIEAMAEGVPVVACRVAAIPEMVEDRVTGFLIDVDDDDGLLTAVQTLVGDEDLRQRMGAAGRARAERLFDARATTESLVDVLHEARARHGGT